MLFVKLNLHFAKFYIFLQSVEKGLIIAKPFTKKNKKQKKVMLKLAYKKEYWSFPYVPTKK